MASENVHSFDDDNFDGEVLQSKLPVLVDFTATWCAPCRQLAPIVEKLAGDYQGKVKVGKLDIEAAPKTAQRYGIRSVPTVLVFRGGQKAGQVVGFSSKTQTEIVKLLEA